MRETFAALLLLVACSDPPPPEVERRAAVAAAPGPGPTPAALTVSFAGCAEVRSGPRCVLEPGAALRLWAEVDPGFATTLRLDGVAVASTPVPVEGGLRWVIEPPPTARRLVIEADLDGTPGSFALALEVAAPSRSAALEEIGALEDLAEARRRLARLLPTLDPDDRVTALQLDGDLAYLQDDLDAVTRAYSAGFYAAVAGERTRDASTMAQRLAYVCLALRYDETCARQWLRRDAPLVAIDPEQRMLHAYFEGLLAQHVGDLRSALAAHQAGGHQAHTLGLTTLHAAALIEQMLLVGRLGATERARALREQALALAPELGDPQRSQLLNAVAWMLLEARGRGQATEDPVPLLQRARDELVTQPDAVSQDTRLAITLNLAYAAVLDRRALDARRWLDDIEGAALDHEDRMWRSLLLARVELLEHAPQRAGRHFGTLLAEADRLYEPELRWQALLGRAQVELELGHHETALASYAAAERVLDEQLPRIAMGEGRARFVAERDRGTRGLVDLLLRLDRPDEALCYVRRARGRALRTLARQLRGVARATPAQRQALQRYRETRERLEADYDASWTLPAAAARQRQRQLEVERRDNLRALDLVLDELDPGAPAVEGCTDRSVPAPGELDLHFMRIDDGWVGFAVEASGVTARRLGPVELGDDDGPGAWERWGHALLDPFEASIARARRLRVMPTGELVGVPFHALPVPGSPASMLIDVLPVRYGLDLPRSPSDGAAPRTRAVVVAPPSNLRHAAREVETVARRLGSARWQVRRIEGDAATGDVVRRALPEADLVHYVGHADSDGVGGFSSALSLAHDNRLDVSDVLTLPRAPRVVVLNGCETGRTDPQAMAGGMSLAHAFVLAGAELVVATDEQVPDAAAAALVGAFYEALAAGQDPAEALQTALRQRRGHDAVWLHTRAWIP